MWRGASTPILRCPRASLPLSPYPVGLLSLGGHTKEVISVMPCLQPQQPHPSARTPLQPPSTNGYPWAAVLRAHILPSSLWDLPHSFSRGSRRIQFSHRSQRVRSPSSLKALLPPGGEVLGTRQAGKEKDLVWPWCLLTAAHPSSR